MYNNKSYICRVKRFAILLFLITFVFSNTEFHELFKLPTLISHYLEHKSIDNKVSFIDFIELHYSHSAKHHASEHGHERLPFKTDTSSSITLSEMKFETEFLEKNLNQTETEYLSIYKNVIYQLNTLSGIWQPPRLV
jgi:hypothetical protein